LIITAGSKVWAGYFKEIPHPLYADLGELVTENMAEITGNVALYWQNIEYLDNLFRHLGHRVPLDSIEPKILNSAYANGQIEEVIDCYIHIAVEVIHTEYFTRRVAKGFHFYFCMPLIAMRVCGAISWLVLT
jgi:hypothetical protein